MAARALRTAVLIASIVATALAGGAAIRLV